MSKYTILLTNDDGIDSPLLLPLLDSLAKSGFCEELRFVVPAEEHSWIAQAATPKRPVFTSKYERDGADGFLASGTPADCVSLGVHHLFGSTPDFVISGINIGTNAGLAYYLSSGTVGASRQAFLHGVPSIAFSADMPSEVFEAWGRHDLQELASYTADFARIASQCVRIAPALMQTFSPNEVDLISVNVPWSVDESSRVVLSSLQRTSYQELFSERGDGEFLHQPKGMNIAPPLLDAQSELEEDREVLARGDISVCPIRYKLSPEGSGYLQKLRQALGSS